MSANREGLEEQRRQLSLAALKGEPGALGRLETARRKLAELDIAAERERLASEEQQLQERAEAEREAKAKQEAEEHRLEELWGRRQGLAPILDQHLAALEEALARFLELERDIWLARTRLGTVVEPFDTDVASWPVRFALVDLFPDHISRPPDVAPRTYAALTGASDAPRPGQ